MVSALEGLAVAAGEGDLACPMAADVEEGLQLAVEAMGDDDRLVQDRDRHEVADARQVLGACDQLPGASEDALLLGRGSPGRGRTATESSRRGRAAAVVRWTARRVYRQAAGRSMSTGAPRYGVPWTDRLPSASRRYLSRVPSGARTSSANVPATSLMMALPVSGRPFVNAQASMAARYPSRTAGSGSIRPTGTRPGGGRARPSPVVGVVVDLVVHGTHGRAWRRRTADARRRDPHVGIRAHPAAGGATVGGPLPPTR